MDFKGPHGPEPCASAVPPHLHDQKLIIAKLDTNFFVCHPDSQVERSLIAEEENFSFWKNLILTASFFFLTPLTIGISLFSLLSFNEYEIPVKSSFSGIRVYASLPRIFPSIEGSYEAADARPEIIRQYLNAYGSILEPYASFIVETADKYELDYRLITAIAQQESNLCKYIPPDTHNCWGWGIHSRGTLGFSSYEEGIETVSKGLKEEYIEKGFISIEDIMSKYTPLSNGSWAAGVNLFMSDME